MKESEDDAAKAHQPVANRTRRLSATQKAAGPNCHKEQTHSFSRSVCIRRSERVTSDKLVSILEKDESLRDEKDLKLLDEWSYLVPEAKARVKSRSIKKLLKQRQMEQEETIETIEEKAGMLAQLIQEAGFVIIYTGAGISTSACIPDYRGPNGLWTQIRKTGTFSITKFHDLSEAEPTLTHMAIKELCRRRIVNHVVSQNCDGLHIRSGIPPANLSEIHGNMYIEICQSCEKQYYRQADLTAKTSRFRHKTGRKCHTCKEPNNNLIDTIVLFGERSRSKLPMNWDRAGKAAEKADLIICMGSSLKTLRRYHCLWPKRANKEHETKLVIINLQYTSKDKNAVLKINGKCDVVMKLVMEQLNINIPTYQKTTDPLLHLSTPFTVEERSNLNRTLIFDTKPPVNQSGSQPHQQEKETPDSTTNPISSLEYSRGSQKIKIEHDATYTDSPSSASVTPSSNDGERTSDVQPTDKVENENDQKTTTLKTVNYPIPGWLGKSLGATRVSCYRRKRNGKKGKRTSTASKDSTKKAEPEDGMDLEEQVMDDE